MRGMPAVLLAASLMFLFACGKPAKNNDKTTPAFIIPYGKTIPLDAQEAFAVTETAMTLDLAGENDIRFVQQTQDLGYIIAGNSVVWGTPDSEMQLIRTDSKGKVLWTNKPGKGFMLCVRQTADKGFVASGMKRIAELDSDAFFMTIDPSGKTLWSRTYDDNKKIGKAIFIDPPAAGGYLLTALEYKNGIYKYFRMSTDLAGNMTTADLSLQVSWSTMIRERRTCSC